MVFDLERSGASGAEKFAGTPEFDLDGLKRAPVPENGELTRCDTPADAPRAEAIEEGKVATPSEPSASTPELAASAAAAPLGKLGEAIRQVGVDRFDSVSGAAVTPISPLERPAASETAADPKGGLCIERLFTRDAAG